MDKWRRTRFNIPITYQKLGVFQGDAQNLYSERVTIAGRQGASEKKNFEVHVDEDKKPIFDM